MIDGITASVQVLRSQIDGKMASILSGTGGTYCQFCTASFKQIHDLDLVHGGFPINRLISDAKAILQEVDEEEFLSLSSDLRFNLTHVPISEKDNPVHPYTHTLDVQLVYVHHSPFNCWSEKMVTNFIDSFRFKIVYLQLN